MDWFKTPCTSCVPLFHWDTALRAVGQQELVCNCSKETKEAQASMLYVLCAVDGRQLLSDCSVKATCALPRKFFLCHKCVPFS